MSEQKKPLLEMREEVPIKKVFWTPARVKDLKEWIVSIVVAVAIVIVVRMFLFTIIRVDGHSMDDTLSHNERLFVTVLDVKLKGVEREDVVICRYPDRGFDRFVKRVVGVAGDVIRMEGANTYINGELIEEDYVTRKDTRSYGEFTVPEGCVFVCGDNRANSHDSRYSDVGFLENTMIIGKVRYVIWPLTKIRGVE